MDNDDLQKMKLESLGQLSGGIAHDFNNILSIIEGYAKLAVKHKGNEAEFDICMQKILCATQRGAGITRQLLSFSRKKIAVESVESVACMVQEQAALLKPLLGAHYNLQLDIADMDCHIKASRDCMGQILTNLCINARDAMPQGGDIIVTVRPDLQTSQAVITVRDFGTGMDSETVAHIFDPFFTTKETGKGTGLGMATVYGLVQQMGGDIAVETKLGEGTLFTIGFPLVAAPKAEIEQIRHKDNPSLQGKTILLVEDEPDLRAVLMQRLKDVGLQVTCADNGRQALEIAEFLPPFDFMLTDIVMPEMTGDRLGALFAKKYPQTHIFYMSGYPERGLQTAMPQETPIMMKPLDFEKFIDLLADQSAESDMSGFFMPTALKPAST